MVDENGFLVDDDAMSRVSGDDQEDMDDLNNPECLDRDLYMSDDTSQSSGDEDGEGDQDDTNPGDQDEIFSPPQVPDHQGAPEVRPSGTPGLATKVSKKRKATDEIIEVFAGPSKKRDPSHVKLREIGWSMAQKVFQSSDVWPTKDANAFMAKHLCLVPDQKKELDKDLIQEPFLKDFKKVPAYRASFEYKNKMFASLRAQRTALVPLFKSGDEIAKA